MEKIVEPQMGKTSKSVHAGILNIISAVLSFLWTISLFIGWAIVSEVWTVPGGVGDIPKFVPVVTYWLCKRREISPRLGLAIGAIAGAGFGTLEAQWTLNYIIHSGWTWGAIQEYGVFIAFAGFWEAFFAMSYNIAVVALAGWGLGRGWGWQFYLLAALAYMILMYSPALQEGNLMEALQVELVIAAWALLLTGLVLWLRGYGNKEKEVNRQSALS